MSFKNNSNAFGYSQYQGISKSETESVSFIKATYMLFAASMLAGGVGAYLGIPYASVVAANYWWIAIPWMLFGMFGLQMIKNKPGINMIGLFAFTFISGVIITPLLSKVLTISGGATIIGNAFFMTAALFGALSLFAIKSRSDFTSYTKPVIIAFIVMIVASLINAFILKSPLAHIAIQSIFLFIISFMVLIDTQNIVNGAYDSPMDGAVALYLDFFNMFVTLLQLFGIFGGSDE